MAEASSSSYGKAFFIQVSHHTGRNGILVAENL